MARTDTTYLRSHKFQIFIPRTSRHGLRDEVVTPFRQVRHGTRTLIGLVPGAKAKIPLLCSRGDVTLIRVTLTLKFSVRLSRCSVDMRSYTPPLFTSTQTPRYPPSRPGRNKSHRVNPIRATSGGAGQLHVCARARCFKFSVSKYVPDWFPILAPFTSTRRGRRGYVIASCLVPLC